MRDRKPIWSTAELPALVDALARKSGIAGKSEGVVNPPAMSADLRVWFENTAQRLGIEVDGVDLWGFQILDKLRAGAPAAVPIEGGWLAMLDVRRGRAALLAPDLTIVRVPLEEVRRGVAEKIEAPHRPEVEQVLNDCGIAAKRRERAARALLFERARYGLAGTMFELRMPPGAPFMRQMQQAGLLTRAGMLFGAHLVEYVLWIVAWYILGNEALQGQVDEGWLMGFALTLATLVPFRMLTTWCQGVLAIGGGGLLRQRLLTGALKLSPEEVRHEGAGRFLARSIEAEMVESLALSGGLLSALAVIEIVLAMAVLSQGASGLLQTVLLMLWTALAIWAAARFWRRRSDWTATRLAMTHDLVERMTGYRTRAVQQSPAEWHIDEDRQTDEYAARSTSMDAAHARLQSLIPNGWMVAGVASLGPAFLGASASSAKLAVSIGGLLLAWRALKRLTSGVGNLSAAAISWKQIAALFDAAARVEPAGAIASEPVTGDVVLDVKDLVFRRESSGRTILDGVYLELHRGDRILVEGESGGGKSTLVSLLAGLREPSSGLLLCAGLDRRTLGDTLWRRRVVAAPQYHENHVLTGTFAYNLLMGRNWPPHPKELQEAQQVCEELGLGPLLGRMPAGLMQMVGETGWQLSQGERSRLFMARALLQGSEIVILDESFAALDPENLREALECALARAKTLVVVAHP